MSSAQAATNRPYLFGGCKYNQRDIDFAFKILPWEMIIDTTNTDMFYGLLHNDLMDNQQG